MGLRATYAKVEDIPDDAKTLYVEKDGRWVLDVDAVDGVSLADTAKMTKALQAERARADTAEKKILTFDGIDDPVKALADMAKLAELGDLDSITDLSEKHKQQVELAKSQAQTPPVPFGS